MGVISLTLLLLVTVVASSLLARVAAIAILLPLPLVQIALGALIALTLDVRIELDPEIFLLLFIAPLLFLDGWRIPEEGLMRDKWTICALSLGLVVFTVMGAGFFIHWMIPAMPLAVAFALAAILSPTDAVAVSAIASRAPIPKRLLHILEGESLLNDASGLVCMRFAVVAALTGSFSIIEACGTFAWLAACGVAIGLTVTLAANAAKDWVSRNFGEETGSHILISLLIPFGAYMLATRLQASGILAAVTAGIAMNYEERAGRALPVTRIRRAAVWDAVQFAGNGVIFVLLGDQLPGIVAGAERVVQETGHQQTLWLLFYILAINFALTALRALWTWTTLRLILFRAAKSEQSIPAPGWRLIAATSLAGVRGALTLSGVMALPLALLDGAAFPARNLAILLAAGVIVVSLIAANVGLPYLLHDVVLPPDTLRYKEENVARLAAAEAAVQAIEADLHKAAAEREDVELFTPAATRLMALYRQRIETQSTEIADTHIALKVDEIEQRLHLVALGAERNEVYRFARSGKLTDESTRRLVREIDLLESRYRPR